MFLKVFCYFADAPDDAQHGSKMVPKWNPKSNKNLLKIDPQTDAQFGHILASIFYRFWSGLGPKTGSKIDPKSIKIRSWAPLATPRPPKSPN